ncbi:hypothetical protein ABMA10_00250 [Plantibacter sp. RU18]
MIVVGAPGPNSVGFAVGQWVEHEARHSDEFSIDLVKLGELNLPFAEDAPLRDESGKSSHARAWAARVAAADAVIVVTAEYTRGASPMLLSALGCLDREWSCKPIGLVTYAGISGGAGATAALAPTLFALGAIGVHERVELPHAERQIIDGVFYSEADQVIALTAQLVQLRDVTDALRRPAFADTQAPTARVS